MIKKILPLVNWFRVGLAIALATTSLIGLFGCAASPSVAWKSQNALPESVVTQIISDYTKADPEPIRSQLKVWQVKGSQNNRLAIVNFNHPDLCGAWGCLYVGLWMQGDSLVKPVFEHYLDPHVPPERQLFTPLSKEQTEPQPLPCVRTWQPAIKGYFKRLDLCFNRSNEDYQVKRSSTEAI
ncbi:MULTISPECIES: hypothetical protein [unclassified Coleofasciculus]|uniref:hypothetical protein n=1 Tax=unclassified Coleofasciculus TaxID=2692782 RepID=UPI00187F2808|nr:MULTISPECIES: hypothetical protein [unclassified Coleofasciculus]MBE9124752.1 hypothetical protein [Coleofasciculus sp. LEGE 07081]MBE9148204.1 hypothetical protein [Coleofasciculus sp. LEGE 07092]